MTFGFPAMAASDLLAADLALVVARRTVDFAVPAKASSKIISQQLIGTLSLSPSTTTALKKVVLTAVASTRTNAALPAEA